VVDTPLADDETLARVVLVSGDGVLLDTNGTAGSPGRGRGKAKGHAKPKRKRKMKFRGSNATLSLGHVRPEGLGQVRRGLWAAARVECGRKRQQTVDFPAHRRVRSQLRREPFMIGNARTRFGGERFERFLRRTHLEVVLAREQVVNDTSEREYVGMRCRID
jgi:hypothetical protein